jgi:RNA polymerase sigma factor (sigma-70 family)
MHQARGRFVPGSPVVAWAFAIGRRLCIDAWRRAKPERPAKGEDMTDIPHPASVEAETVAALEARRALRVLASELERLSPEHRTMFELVYSGGLSHAEAAASLGLTTNALKLRMHRLTSVLREALADRLT